MSPQPAAVESAYQQAEPSASAASPSQQEMDSSPVQATPKLAGSAGTALR